MSPGPLRQATGLVGLLALVPTAAMLAVGQITVDAAAIRAGVTLVGVVLIGRIARWWLASFLSSLEAPDAQADPSAPRRRVTDRTVSDGRRQRSAVPQ